MIIVVAAVRLKLLIRVHACSLSHPVCVTSVFHLSSFFFLILFSLICTIDPNHSIHPDVFLVFFQPNVSFFCSFLLPVLLTHCLTKRLHTISPFPLQLFPVITAEICTSLLAQIMIWFELFLCR